MVHFIKTLNLAKLTSGKPFKTRCPVAMKMIRSICAKTAKVDEKNVILSEDVNRYVWAQGIRTPMRRIRIDIDVQEHEENKIALVSIVDWPAEGYHGLLNETNE
ncbi:Ribosomal protein L31B [Spironucleus salmonicida]|uniref:Ribosomal protein L31B n=1 Tax=Spironucleus salmonicida TaxID=348837 RepID=V6LDD4_9EUKA|nr:Ribosomal protein L31B [Spironucleus salmonicida]|eukprot:EST41666.1 Ribosomal protein L31B [Spironucleus salmonicida]